MESIAYRKAVLEDCHTLAVLKGMVWNTTYKGIYPDEVLENYDVSKNQSIFESICANPDIDLFVAECSGKVVGLMSCGKPFRPFLHYQQEVGLLYILKEYQRRGIGKEFFEIARKQVREHGYSEFVVSVNRQNQAAIPFYLAMGGKMAFTDEKQVRITYTL